MIPLWPWSVSPLDQTSFSRSGLALHNCSKPTEHKGRCPLGLLEHLKKASNLHISYCWGSYHQPPSQSHPTCRWQHPSRAVLEGLGFVWGGEVKNDQEEALKYKPMGVCSGTIHAHLQLRNRTCTQLPYPKNQCVAYRHATTLWLLLVTSIKSEFMSIYIKFPGPPVL